MTQAKNARGSGVRESDTVRPGRARVRQQEKEEELCRATTCRATACRAGCEQIRTRAAGPRVENVGGRQGESSGRHGSNADRPRPSRRRRGGYGAASWKEKLRSEGGGRA
jgi:hypothetical protein